MFIPGELVIAVGLNRRSDLNYQMGTVMSVVGDRFRVQFPHNCEFARVKAENLKDAKVKHIHFLQR